MLGMCQEKNVLLSEHLKDKPVIVYRFLQGECEIQVSVNGLPAQVGANACAKYEIHLWVAGSKRHQHGSQAIGAETFNGTDGQRTARLRVPAHCHMRLVGQPQDLVRVPEQANASFCKTDLLAEPLKQLNAKFTFQRLDLCRYA
jgi:hypothetical protein